MTAPVSPETSDAARALSALGASKGGHARAAKLSPERRREIARAAVAARWGKTPKPMTYAELLKWAQHELNETNHQLMTLQWKAAAFRKLVDALPSLIEEDEPVS